MSHTVRSEQFRRARPYLRYLQSLKLCLALYSNIPSCIDLLGSTLHDIAAARRALVHKSVLTNYTQSFALGSFFASSLRSFLRIFPEGLLGIASMNTTPPLSCLWDEACFFTKSLISCSEMSPPVTT